MAKSAKHLYWRPSHVPLSIMVSLAVASIASLLLIETFKREDESAAYYSTMLTASETVRKGIDFLRPIRGAIEPIDPEIDPLRLGMIGVSSSPVTSNSGHLPAKLTSVNANWAAVAVKLLVEAGVREGDTVAIGVSGSFPVVNLAVYSAVEALGAKPIVILSATASQWGANVPGHLWIDMARELRGAGIIETKAVAASLGGREDRAKGLSKEGVRALRQSIEKADIPFLEVPDYRTSVARRITLYKEHAGDAPIKVMINVGGGTAVTGPDSIDHYFENGLSFTAPDRAFAAPSVLGYFLERRVPVINFSGITSLAAANGLPIVPAQRPEIGEGGVYSAQQYQRWLAGLLMIALMGCTWFSLKSASIALLFDQMGKRSRGQLKPKV